MAKQMLFRAYGVDFNESYWRPVAVHIVPVEQRAGAVWYGYASKEARDNGEAPIGQRTYEATGVLFAEYLSVEALSAAGVNPVRNVYDLAMLTRDVPRHDEAGQPVTDEEGQQVFDSFFEGAEDV